MNEWNTEMNAGERAGRPLALNTFITLMIESVLWSFKIRLIVAVWLKFPKTLKLIAIKFHTH